MGIVSKFIVPVAAAAILFGSSIAAHATTVSPDVTTFPSGNIEYDYEGLANDDFTDTDIAGGGGINLQAAPESLLEAVVTGDGSLTVATYVDPFINAGVGGANVRLRIGGAVFPPGTITVSWGGGPVIDLSDGSQQAISTVFAQAGAAGARNLVFTWVGAEDIQLSARLAAVPIPAAGLLLLGGLGGLVMMRRRRKAA